jgi:4a-hydroxytetrahydrobiopterin dehydratase
MTAALVNKTCTPCRGGIPPLICFGWGNATVSLQTKKIKGLHENDFIMAAKIDRIFARSAI